MQVSSVHVLILTQTLIATVCRSMVMFSSFLSSKKNYWTGFWHYTYGNCFSFNQKKGLRAGGPGPGNGKLLGVFFLPWETKRLHL